MTTPTADWASRMDALDRRLRPIANRPVDVTDPDWLNKLQAADPAVDRAGVRGECEALLGELVTAYEHGDEDVRQEIRRLFRESPSFAWAASPSGDYSTPSGLRTHLIHFSMLDLGRDPRDAQLSLDGILDAARRAGTPTGDVLEQVAALSNGAPVYPNWPSTSGMLLEARERARQPDTPQA
jgi:hypothetical protein